MHFGDNNISIRYVLCLITNKMPFGTEFGQKKYKAMLAYSKYVGTRRVAIYWFFILYFRMHTLRNVLDGKWHISCVFITTSAKVSHCTRAPLDVIYRKWCFICIQHLLGTVNLPCSTTVADLRDCKPQVTFTALSMIIFTSE